MPWSLQTVGSTIYYIPSVPSAPTLPLSGAGSVTSGGGTIIMVGRGTNSIASYNIATGTWSLPSTIFSSTGRSVAYGNQKYVAVGEGANKVAISNDSSTWGLISSPPFSGAGYDIVYAGSTWVAVGQGTNSVAYFDGTSWISINNGITSGYGLYYDALVPRIWATGSGTSLISYASTPSGTWTTSTIAGILQVNAMGVYLSKIVTVGFGTTYSATTPLSYYSTNGTTFSSSTTLFRDVSCIGGAAIAYGNGVYVWGGFPGTGGKTIAYSTDGINWTGVAGSASLCPGVYRITYGNGIFMSAGGKGTATSVLKSSDGITWNNTPFWGSGGGAGGDRSIAFGGTNRWIVGGSGSTGMYYSDDNGNNWTSIGLPLTHNQITDIGFGNGWWICGTFGNGNTIYRSNTGNSSWTSPNLHPTIGGAVNLVKYGYGTTWLAGANGSAGTPVLLKSGDSGNNWATVLAFNNTTGFTSINGALYLNGRWYISGAGASSCQFAYSIGTNASSPTGYSDFTFVTNINLNGGVITTSFNSSQVNYVVGGIGINNLQTSTNGTTWSSVTSPFSVAVNDVKNNGSIWVAVGEGASHTIATSTNGTNWTGRGTSTFSLRGNKVRWNSAQSRWYAVGEGINTLASSTDGITWTGISTTGFVDVSGMGLTFNAL